MLTKDILKKASASDIANWKREIQTGANGELPLVKQASEDFTRLYLRETGVARVVLPPETVTQSDIDHFPGVKEPYITYEIEPESPAAISLGFNGAPDQYRIEMNQYMMTFWDISTREYGQNVKYLLAYKNDPREIFTSNGLKDMQTEEDLQFFGGIDASIGATPNAISTLTGDMQNISIESPATAPRAWNREALVEAFKTLVNFKLPQGTAVCNAATFMNFGAFDRTEAGGDLSQEMMLEGTAALKKAEALGQRFVVSIKNEIFADDTLYLLTEPAFLGRFNELVAPTMYVEKKIDIIKFQARETIGIALANTRGYAKITFTQAS